MNELPALTVDKMNSFTNYDFVELPLLKRIRREIDIKVQAYQISSIIQYQQCVKESLLDHIYIAIPENPKELIYIVINAVDHMIKDPIRRSISDLFMLAEVIPGN